MELLGAYKNGNYRTLILSDGTKIRKTNDDEFVPDFAENMDIKITNKCNMNCPMCHEGSTEYARHGYKMNNMYDLSFNEWLKENKE